MYKQKLNRRNEEFKPNCVSRNGKRLEKAFKMLERRHVLQEGGYFGERQRRGSSSSAIEFEEEAWIDKTRCSAYGGRK